MYEIAQRVLVLETVPPREVTVAVGMPYEEAGEWACPYRVDGLAGWEHERRATGRDSLEAVEVALAMVRAALAGSHEAKEGLLQPDDAPPDRQLTRTVYVTWDKGQDIAYIAMKHEIVPGEAVRQTVSEDVVLDYSASGDLLGLELLNAATRLPAEMRL
ncbi:DUF2283 domain-containing protein [Actinomadura sp. ATCC 39365]|uniref:DUF2283 domain-containing protein n=1 Tax=Nonomuraea sp. NPDC005692 TaxID=3157168 RepID=UPI003400C8DD